MSAGLGEPARQTGYHLVVWPSAREAGGSLRLQAPRAQGAGGGALRPAAGLAGEVARAVAAQRSREEADRRARGNLRRFSVANELDRLLTLTYSTSCRNPLQVRADVRSFFRKLRAGLGGQPMPYLWVPEWHPKGHGLHVHGLVGSYIPRRCLEQAWGRGFVHIKRLTGGSDGDDTAGDTVQQRAARCAAYASKYVGKTLDGRQPGLHRYEVSQGHQPKSERVWGRTEAEALAAAAARMGAEPVYVWRSEEQLGWAGPPAVWASWV